MSAIARIATARPSTTASSAARRSRVLIFVALGQWQRGGAVQQDQATMPPDRPGQLSDQTYVDLTAFLLSQNGYAAGNGELPADLEAQQKMSLKK